MTIQQFYPYYIVIPTFFFVIPAKAGTGSLNHYHTIHKFSPPRHRTRGCDNPAILSLLHCHSREGGNRVSKPLPHNSQILAPVTAHVAVAIKSILSLFHQKTNPAFRRDLRLPHLLLDTDLEFIAPTGNRLATNRALDILKTIFYLLLFHNVTGN